MISVYVSACLCHISAYLPFSIKSSECEPCSIISPLESVGGEVLKGAIYATIVGSNLGALLTPIGALAGIMWSSMLKEQKVKYTYLNFIKYGAIISVPSLLINLGVLSLII